MKECAFCPHTGKFSAEHITSCWISDLFPGKISARRFDQTTGTHSELNTSTLDFKAKVVCENCNQTWMSDIEGQHAKPVLTPLITGETGIHVGLSEARSMALFSFTTAVILDHSARRGQVPFFDRIARHNFREKLAIPGNVQMWLCAFLG